MEEIAPMNHTVPSHQVIAEHGDQARPKPQKTVDLELDVQSRVARKFIRQCLNCRAVTVLACEAGSTQEHIELEVIVGLVAVGCAQHATVAPPIAAAKNNALKALAGDQGLEPVANGTA
jgi:hypothetical protein